ncbi:MAG: hypothetical protein U0V54_12105 [Saprospiraceae bacterium]|nr:hypothetical protein [Saprospiraceae bacterium]
MKNKGSEEKLNQLIQLVEARKKMEWLETRAALHELTDALKPSHFVAATFDELAKPQIKEKLVSSALTLLAGYLTRKWIVGKSNSPVRKTLGFLMQALVSKLLAKRI